MQIQIKIVKAGDFIRTTADGALDLNNSKSILNEVCKKAKSESLPILIDVRKTESVMSMHEIFQLASHLYEYGRTFKQKTAILNTKDRMDKTKFFEMVATHGGYNIEAFTDFEDAIYWLTDADH